MLGSVVERLEFGAACELTLCVEVIIGLQGKELPVLLLIDLRLSVRVLTDVVVVLLIVNLGTAVHRNVLGETAHLIVEHVWVGLLSVEERGSFVLSSLPSGRVTLLLLWFHACHLAFQVR